VSKIVIRKNIDRLLEIELLFQLLTLVIWSESPLECLLFLRFSYQLQPKQLVFDLHLHLADMVRMYGYFSKESYHGSFVCSNGRSLIFSSM